MSKRNTLFTLCALATLAIVAASSGDASDFANKMDRLTFSRPIALPGVTLAAGTYIFERASPNAIEVVRVSSQDRRFVYYAGFTELVNRPDGVPRNQPIAFAEAPAGAAVPVAAWYPLGTNEGHRFIYR